MSRGIGTRTEQEVDDLTVLGRDDERHALQEFLAQYDAPAYVRRAVNVEGALEEIQARCRRQRDEWLTMTRTRLAILRALAGDWSALAPCLQDESQLDVLRALEAELRPSLRATIAPTTSLRALKQALSELCESLARFNRRWPAFLEAQDLRKLNELREDYNRYYLLEKECAVRSSRLARQGFRKLPPARAQDLLRLFPLLPVPALKS